MMHAMRKKLAEFTRDTGLPGSGGAGGSAAVGESPAGAGPTAVQETTTVAVGTGIVQDTEERETICRDGVSRILVHNGTQRSCSSSSGWSGEGSTRPARERCRESYITQK